MGYTHRVRIFSTSSAKVWNFPDHNHSSIFICLITKMYVFTTLRGSHEFVVVATGDKTPMRRTTTAHPWSYLTQIIFMASRKSCRSFLSRGLTPLIPPEAQQAEHRHSAICYPRNSWDVLSAVIFQTELTSARTLRGLKLSCNSTEGNGPWCR